MPTAKIGGISIIYEFYGHGEPLVIVGGLANDVSDYTMRSQIIDEPCAACAFPRWPYTEEDMISPCWLAEEMHGKVSGLRMVAFDGGCLFLFLHAREFSRTVPGFLRAA